MKRAKTPSHILTLPLICELWQRDYLDKLFRVSGNIYNNLVADRLGALKQLERTKAWKSVQAKLSTLYMGSQSTIFRPGCRSGEATTVSS